VQAESQADMTLAQMQAQARLEEISRDLQSNIQQIQAAMQADLTIERAQAQYDIASQEVDHTNNIRQIAAQNRGQNDA